MRISDRNGKGMKRKVNLIEDLMAKAVQGSFCVFSFWLFFPFFPAPELRVTCADKIWRQLTSPASVSYQSLNHCLLGKLNALINALSLLMLLWVAMTTRWTTTQEGIHGNHILFLISIVAFFLVKAHRHSAIHRRLHGVRLCAC